MNIAPVATSKAASRAPSSGSIVFVSHAYDAQAHHTAVRIKNACPSPLHVGLWDSSVVTCVKAKTNTRSKKSSSGATDADPPAARSPHLVPGRRLCPGPQPSCDPRHRSAQGSLSGRPVGCMAGDQAAPARSSPTATRRDACRLERLPHGHGLPSARRRGRRSCGRRLPDPTGGSSSSIGASEPFATTAPDSSGAGAAAVELCAQTARRDPVEGEGEN
jgi:hypothetical protein